MSADEQAIRELIAEWMRATEAGEVEALADLMTAEMIFLTARNVPMTKEAFLEGMRAMVPTVLIRSESDIQEVCVEGAVAWCWNHLTVRVTPRDGGETKVMQGTTLGIYRKGEDGRWRLHRDANLVG